MEEQEYYYPSGATQQGAVSDDLIRWQLSGDNIIDDTEHKLRGDVWNIKSRAWEKRYKPMMNEDGINSIMSMIAPILTPNVFLSDLEEEHINNITMHITLDLISMLQQKYRVWNIEPSHLNSIVGIVEYQVFVALRRAFKAGTQKFLTTTQRYIEQRVQRPASEEQKQNLFSKFNLMKRK